MYYENNNNSDFYFISFRVYISKIFKKDFSTRIWFSRSYTIKFIKFFLKLHCLFMRINYINYDLYLIKLFLLNNVDYRTKGWFSIFEMNTMNHYNGRGASATDEIIFRSLYTVFKSNQGRKKEVVEASSVDLHGVSGWQARLYLYRWFARSVTVLNSLGIGRTSAGCKFAWRNPRNSTTLPLFRSRFTMSRDHDPFTSE